MNGKMKIFSKANMLEQNFKMSLVLVITVLISLFLNNTFIIGELVSRIPSVSLFLSPVTKNILLVLVGVLSYVAVSPFNYGRDIWFYENARKNKLHLGKLFYFYRFKKSFGAIKIVFSVHLRKFLVTLLFLTPSIAIGGYILYALREGIGQLIFITLCVSTVLLAVTGAFFSFAFSQRYFLVPYLYFENEPCRASEVIKLSGKIMEKKCFETAMLKLSFFPWWLLCVLVFPTVYVYPYYKLTISYKAISILLNNA